MTTFISKGQHKAWPCWIRTYPDFYMSSCTKCKLEIIVYVTRPLFRRPVITSGTTASAAFEGNLLSWLSAFADSTLRFGAPGTNGSDKKESWCSRSGCCSKMASNFSLHASHSVSSSSLTNMYFSHVSRCIDSAERRK